MATYQQKYYEWCKSKVGTEAPKGDDQFIEYYNQVAGTSFSVNGTAWCAIFCSCGARQVGIPTNVIPNFASCTTFRDSWAKPNNRWRSRSNYTPKMGDLIFLDWDKSGNCDHVEFVYNQDGTYVYSIGGNTKGGYSQYGVRYKKYKLTDPTIAGYFEPNYASITGNGTSSVVVSPNESANDNNIVAGVKKFQQWLNSYVDAGLVLDGECGRTTRTAAIKALQTCLNKKYGKKIHVDGKYDQSWRKDIVTIKQNDTGDIVKIAQGLLYGHEMDPDGFDGSFGPGMLAATEAFQKWVKEPQDGIIDDGTWYNLIKRWAWY